MKGILADHDAAGHLARAVRLLDSSELGEYWRHLNVPALNFADVGLPENSSDAAVWFLCQARSLILFTGNRNADGADSLQSVIVTHGHATSLPVFTVGDLDRVLKDSVYALRVGADMLEYLYDLADHPEKILGSGRLFLPRSAQN